MKTSEKINEITIALSQLQSEIKDARLDGHNPHYDSDFASLKSYIHEIKPLLMGLGLAVIQGGGFNQHPITGDISWYLETKIFHVSGQWIEFMVPLINEKKNMQGLVAAITYARRVSLGPAFLMADRDDDGESTIAPTLSIEKEHSIAAAIERNMSLATSKQVKSFIERLKISNIDFEKVKQLIESEFKVKKSTELTLAQLNSLESKIAKDITKYKKGTINEVQ